ncbi:hypothetical protein OG21DRAFT_1379858, partial [Imleria badia]
TIALPPVQLLRDVRICWDSSYFMTNRLRALCQIIELYLAVPRNADVVHTDNKLVGLDWEVLQDLEFILEV